MYPKDGLTPGALTEGKCSAAPPDEECEVLRAPCCGEVAGKPCRHELCSGLFSLQPAGQGNTSYAERYMEREKCQLNCVE